MNVDRELPVVWAVAKGSFVNKLILVPVALALSAFVPIAIMPLMMLGGLFLCYEGCEKLAHKLLHSAGEDEAHHKAHRQALANSAVDLVALEKDKVKGAVRTDFVLSAEIIVITLGTMSTAPLAQQVLALSIVAIAATIFVYGLVAGIVKLDNLGCTLLGRQSPVSRRIGAGILRSAPWLMKALSVLGTIAMFTVGGSILVHGVHAVAALFDRILAPLEATSHVLAKASSIVLEALFGIACGAVVLGIVKVGQRMFSRRAKN